MIHWRTAKLNRDCFSLLSTFHYSSHSLLWQDSNNLLNTWARFTDLPDSGSEIELKIWVFFYTASTATNTSANKDLYRYTKCPINPIRARGERCVRVQPLLTESKQPKQQRHKRTCIKKEIHLLLFFFFGHEEGVIGRTFKKENSGMLSSKECAWMSYIPSNTQRDIGRIKGSERLARRYPDNGDQ